MPEGWALIGWIVGVFLAAFFWIACIVYGYEIAKSKNRKEDGWLAIAFALLGLIIIYMLPKLAYGADFEEQRKSREAAKEWNLPPPPGLEEEKKREEKGDEDPPVTWTIDR